VRSERSPRSQGSALTVAYDGAPPDSDSRPTYGTIRRHGVDRKYHGKHISPRTTATRATLHAPPGAAITINLARFGAFGDVCQSRQCAPRDAAVRVEGGSSITDIWPVAVQALPEPYVPGSGDRVPAELRLVLAGYAGIAGGLLAGALACATALVFFFFIYDIDQLDRYSGLYDLLFFLALLAFLGGAFAGAWAGAWEDVHALRARIRFSTLLRRRSDPRTATVTASKRGGRTLILDIIPGDGAGHRYQSLSEVRLALWLNAGMLVPGETVNVYGASGKGSQLLISSPLWGRAFLGTVESQSALQPRLLDEKVSRATLVEWAAWAASTTFSSTGLKSGYDKREVDAFRIAVRDTFLGTGLKSGYDKREVDAFRSAVRDAFLGIRGPAVKSDDIRGKQFSTHRPGYDKKQVEAFLEAVGIRLAPVESTDRPAGPLVSGALLVAWADWAESTTFSKASWRRRGYEQKEVDAFREEIRDTFLGATRSPVRANNVRGTQFSSATPLWREDPHYDKKQVAAFLDAANIRLAAMESTGRPDGPLVSGAILAGWAEWADSTRFSTTARLSKGYDTAEVDAFRERLGDTFLGVRQPPVISDSVRGKRFSTHRPGYDTLQVDAFLDTAAWRLAAMKSDGQAGLRMWTPS
jgi:DivIVA domain-containing protein